MRYLPKLLPISTKHHQIAMASAGSTPNPCVGWASQWCVTRLLWSCNAPLSEASQGHKRVRDAGLVGWLGTIGDGYDGAMIESFWSTMQVELLNRQTWRTRIELANAIFDYIEIYYNRTRRHSSIGLESPVTFEKLQKYEAIPARTLITHRSKTPDTSGCAAQHRFIPLS